MEIKDITVQLCEYMAEMGFHVVISDGEVVEFVKQRGWQHD